LIAIDTNVLLRYLLADDAVQSKKAKKLILQKRPILITDVVLTETLWTLVGKRYSVDKASVCHTVRSLLGDSAFVFEDSQVIWSSLNDFENAKAIRGKHLDFADTLIANKARYIAANQGKELSGFYSFDKAVEQLDDAKIP
jgi:predicted nucleic-acid-binding protein